MDRSTQEVKTEDSAVPTKEELRINVSANALRQVLEALVGPQHLVRELQVTRGLPGFENPIDKLIDEFNVEVKRLNYCEKEEQATNALHTSPAIEPEALTDNEAQASKG